MAEFTTLTTYAINCPACESERVVKDGFQRGTQRYECKACQKKFRANGKAQGRRIPSEWIGAAIRDYYTGMSYKQIGEGMASRYDIPEPSKATIYEWVRDFTDKAVEEMANHKATTGDHWVADEMQVDVGGEKAWLWNVMDWRSRYILASHLSRERDAQAAKTVFRKALAAADKPPAYLFTDNLRSYLPVLRDVLPTTKHYQSEGMKAAINNNLSERLQGTYRSRIKTLRGLDSMETGQRYLDGWGITYNLFREHEGIHYVTPAKRASVNPPFTEWAGVVKAGAASPQPVAVETRLAVPKQPKRKLPKIQPPKCGQRQPGKAWDSPVPPSAFAALPKALRPKPPKAGRKSRAHSIA